MTALVLKQLSNPDLNVHIQALRAVSNLLTSEDDMYAKFALFSGVLDQFNKLAKDFIP